MVAGQWYFPCLSLCALRLRSGVAEDQVNPLKAALHGEEGVRLEVAQDDQQIMRVVSLQLVDGLLNGEDRVDQLIGRFRPRFGNA